MLNHESYLSHESDGQEGPIRAIRVIRGGSLPSYVTLVASETATSKIKFKRIVARAYDHLPLSEKIDFPEQNCMSRAQAGDSTFIAKKKICALAHR